MSLLLAWISGLSLGGGVLFALVANALTFAGALAFGHLVARRWRGRPVAEPPPPLAQSEITLATACVVLNAGVMFAGWWLFRAGFIRVDGTDNPLRWLLDAVLLVVLMDFAMYATHRVAHWRPIYRWVHGIHHRYEHPRPLTLFVIHPLEVLGFGGLWLSVLLLHGFALGGMMIYLGFNVLFGVIGHIGVEPVPRLWARVPLLRRIGTSTFHARHHQLHSKNFGFYTGLWDRLFGTLDADYERTFGRWPR